MSAVFRHSKPDAGMPTDDEVARLRVPPHSIEAEQSVLGGLLIDNLAWDRAADLLTERLDIDNDRSLDVVAGPTDRAGLRQNEFTGFSNFVGTFLLKFLFVCLTNFKKVSTFGMQTSQFVLLRKRDNNKEADNDGKNTFHE